MTEPSPARKEYTAAQHAGYTAMCIGVILIGVGAFMLYPAIGWIYVGGMLVYGGHLWAKTN